MLWPTYEAGSCNDTRCVAMPSHVLPCTAVPRSAKAPPQRTGRAERVSNTCHESNHQPHALVINSRAQESNICRVSCGKKGGKKARAVHAGATKGPRECMRGIPNPLQSDPGSCPNHGNHALHSLRTARALLRGGARCCASVPPAAPHVRQKQRIGAGGRAAARAVPQRGGAAGRMRRRPAAVPCRRR